MVIVNRQWCWTRTQAVYSVFSGISIPILTIPYYIDTSVSIPISPMGFCQAYCIPIPSRWGLSRKLGIPIPSGWKAILCRLGWSVFSTSQGPVWRCGEVHHPAGSEILLSLNKKNESPIQLWISLSSNSKWNFLNSLIYYHEAKNGSPNFFYFG